MYYRKIRVRPLADNIAQSSNQQPVVDGLYRETMRLGAENYPLVDYHVHLKGGLTIEQALANSRSLGINYGIAGLGFPVYCDDSLRQYLESMKG